MAANGSCAGSVTLPATTAAAIVTKRKADRACTSVSGEAEIALRPALRPGADETTMVGADVFEPPLGHNARRLSPVLGLRLDPHRPCRPIDRHAGQRNGVRARVDQTGDGLAVPAHHRGHVGP